MKKPSIFSTKLRELARSIPKGKVTTYGLLARAAGGGGQAARSVSSILAKDPDYKSIPFHRIVYSNGRVWQNERCGTERLNLLKKEGIPVDEKGRIEMFQDYLYLK